MKHTNTLLLITKIVAILIVVAYGVGLFRAYNILQAGALFIVALCIGADLVIQARLASKSGVAKRK